MCIYCILLLALFLLGVGVRREVLNAQSAPGWDELPFTMESALHFRTIATLLKDGSLPKTDKYVQHPEGVETAKIYSLSDEYLVAGLIGILPETGSLTARVRWISLVWFCLGIPLMALWISVISRSKWAGCIAGAFYAVMLAAVIRSTGQELSRENFALPLLLAHLCLSALARRKGGGIPAVVLSLLSGLALGLALATWDLVQFFIFISWLVEAVLLVFDRSGEPERFKWRIIIEVLATVGVALLSPYHRAHGLLFSPVTMLGLGLVSMRIYDIYRARRNLSDERLAVCKWTAIRLGIIFTPMLLCFILNSMYGDHYDHFGELLLAKLQFMNIKPADPSLLSFNARIMWVPALNSANSRILFMLFPYTLLLTIPFFLLTCVLIYRANRSRADLLLLLVAYSASFIAFLLFVRFHVFLAVFTAGVIGYGASLALTGPRLRRGVLLAIMALALIGEGRHVLAAPERWGRPLVYYQEMRELLDWIGENIEGEPVLANFGQSAMIRAYAGNPIVLHPKFEAPDIRARVKEYAEIMFTGEEDGLRDWMEKYSVRYLVYALGEFSDVKPEWQMRYFVDALQPGERAPARLFEYEASGLDFFKTVWQNRKYRVFRLVTRADERAAADLVVRARRDLQNGRVEAAHEAAARALLLDPNQSDAVMIIQQSGSLINQGFGGNQ